MITIKYTTFLHLTSYGIKHFSNLVVLCNERIYIVGYKFYTFKCEQYIFWVYVDYSDTYSKKIYCGFIKETHLLDPNPNKRPSNIERNDKIFQQINFSTSPNCFVCINSYDYHFRKLLTRSVFHPKFTSFSVLSFSYVLETIGGTDKRCIRVI